MPAAGTFDNWPKTVDKLRSLDPCMGSGHFVVAMFERLTALRVAELGMGGTEAVAAVISENLFGLEIDPRCTQIAAFNLALAAWRRVGYCVLPPMNLACSGLAPNVKKAEWIKLAGDDDQLQRGMARLHALFSDAPVLGSLVNPRSAGADLVEAEFQKLQPLLEMALARESQDDDAHEIAVTAHGISKAAKILASNFTLVATNVPYLGRGKQDDTLSGYCKKEHPEAKADLATCFIERCFLLGSAGGTSALVTPQNWLFLSPYKHLRKRALAGQKWEFLARLGAGAFETISGEVVNVALLAFTNTPPTKAHSLFGIDTSTAKSAVEKAAGLISKDVSALSQKAQASNPDCIITLSEGSGLPLLGAFADSYAGVCTGDYPRFGRCFWEVSAFHDIWEFQCSTVKGSSFWKGREGVLRWEHGQGQLYDFVADRLGPKNVGSWLRGKDCWGKAGLGVSLMTSLPVSIYSGELFDDNLAVLIPKQPTDLPALLAYCSSPDFHREVRRINQKLALKTQYLVKVPFDEGHWKKIAAEKYPQGLPKPVSDDATQWLFTGCPSDCDQPLQVAVARMLGYEWPRRSGSSFNDCPTLDQDDLAKHADVDGIACLAAIHGEPPADERLNALLSDAFGADWSAGKLLSLLKNVGFAGKTLDDWLRDGFFQQHCDLFYQRPFIWHVWDGRHDGFHAMVNYHRLTAPNEEGGRTLDKLIYTYLGAWIERQQLDQEAGVEGADGRLAAAQHLKAELEKIRKGEPPFDIFVRWKPIADQPVGWNPDINDGVRINIRPFMTARPLGAKAKNACIFRTAPRISWDRDRGKEPERPKYEFPWFWNWDGSTADFLGNGKFDGVRWNDLHYSLSTKRAASKKDAA